MDGGGVRDASRRTPLCRPPDSRPGHDVSLSVDLDSGFELGTIKSVSHAITDHRLPDGRHHVELASGATIPNKDFVLEVRQAESRQPKTALFLSPDPGSGDTYFLLSAFPPTVQPAKRRPVEMLYTIDVSGSMAGTSITQAREALLQALDRLGPNDRFGILAFNNDYSEIASEPQTPATENLAAARRFVENLEAFGRPDMLPPLLPLTE